ILAQSQELKLPFKVVEVFFQESRQQQLVEVKQSLGLDYRFTLTSSGRSQAAARMEVCQYIGPAPVSLHEYERVVRAQAAVVDVTTVSIACSSKTATRSATMATFRVAGSTTSIWATCTSTPATVLKSTCGI